MKEYFLYFKDRKFLMNIFISLLLLGASFVVNFYAGNYATRSASNSVTDIILSNIRVYDVDAVFVWGAIVFWFFMIVLFILKPKKIPFTIKSIALFTLIRSVFISLTHLGPFPTQIVIVSKFSFGADLFFSGHTGLPFLMALIFWQNKTLRYLFLVSSLLFGVVVLMGHLHYSIDVLAAFFITYTIFHIALFFFKKDWQIFIS